MKDPIPESHSKNCLPIKKKKKKKRTGFLGLLSVSAAFIYPSEADPETRIQVQVVYLFERYQETLERSEKVIQRRERSQSKVLPLESLIPLGNYSAVWGMCLRLILHKV